VFNTVIPRSQSVVIDSVTVTVVWLFTHDCTCGVRAGLQWEQWGHVPPAHNLGQSKKCVKEKLCENNVLNITVITVIELTCTSCTHWKYLSYSQYPYFAFNRCSLSSKVGDEHSIPTWDPVSSS